MRPTIGVGGCAGKVPKIRTTPAHSGKGKLAINGTFQQLTSPATAAYFHRGADGQRGPRVATLMVTKGATGVIKGDVMLTADDIAELQKGVYYVEIATEKAADGEVRGWLRSGMLK